MFGDNFVGVLVATWLLDTGLHRSDAAAAEAGQRTNHLRVFEALLEIAIGQLILPSRAAVERVEPFGKLVQQVEVLPVLFGVLRQLPWAAREAGLKDVNYLLIKRQENYPLFLQRGARGRAPPCTRPRAAGLTRAGAPAQSGSTGYSPSWAASRPTRARARRRTRRRSTTR